MKFAHINIVANNWKLLADFYCDVFGCEIVPPRRNQEGEWLAKGTGVPNAQLEGVHLRLPGHGENAPTLEIYQYRNVIGQKAVEPNQRGFGHIAFEIEHIEEVISKVLLHNGSLNGELTVRKIDGVGDLTFIYVRDLEGNLIELQTWN